MRERLKVKGRKWREIESWEGKLGDQNLGRGGIENKGSLVLFISLLPLYFYFICFCSGGGSISFSGVPEVNSYLSNESKNDDC